MKPPLQKLAESDWRHLRQDSTAIPGSLPGTERRCCKDGDLIEIFDR